MGIGNSKSPAASPTASRKPWADQPFKLIESPGSKVPKPWNPYVAGATDMVNVHNGIIRYLNSIYLQAPHIPASEKTDFIRYCQSWSKFLHAHHDGEETLFFPKIEAAVGKPGCMSANVDQHAAFSVGLKEYDDYLQTTLSTDPKSFSGDQLRGIIDRFGPTLTTHLHDEIATLLELESLGANIDLVKMGSEEADEVVKMMDPATTIVAIMRCFDKEYEDGLHKDFPSLPGFVLFLSKWVWSWPNRKWWKWSPCDKHGRRKELGGLGDDKSAAREEQKRTGVMMTQEL